MHSQTNKINSLRWDVSFRALPPLGRTLPNGKRSAPGPGGEGEDVGAFVASSSPFSSLAGRAEGLCRAQSCRSPSPGGVSLAWLLPISFTSGWNRWRGVGWKSPSGWESHKCVNKCDDQSLLRCPGNPGLSAGGMPGCPFFPPLANRAVWEGKALGEKPQLFQGKLMFAVMLQLFLFQVSNAMTN